MVTLLLPPAVPPTVTVVTAETGAVATVKLAALCPAGTRYGDWTWNEPSLADTLTVAPPFPAGPLSVRVSVAVLPALTMAGLIAIELRLTDEAVGVTVTVAVWLAPL